MKTVAVVIPTYRRPEMVRALVSSLQKGSRLPDEIVVVDNDPDRSFGASQDLALPAKSIWIGRAANVSASRNAGWRSTSSDIVFFVDDDNLVGPSTVEVIAHLADNAGFGVVAPVSYTAKDPDFVWCGGLRRSMWTTHTRLLYRGVGRLPSEESWETCDMPNAFAIPRGVLEATGGFDEVAFPIHFEEADLMMRIRSMGFGVIVARRAGVFHHIERDTSAGGIPAKELARALTSGDPERVRAISRSRVLFHRKYGSAAQRLVARGVFLPLWLAASTVAGAFSHLPPRQRLEVLRLLWSGFFQGYRSRSTRSSHQG